MDSRERSKPMKLQWGHRLSAMETRMDSRERSKPMKLQWGHRLSAMETCIAWRGTGVGNDASMGPPPFGDGNRWPGMLTAATRPRFNGATAFRRWKLRQIKTVLFFLAQLQWGHRLSAMETPHQGQP